MQGESIGEVWILCDCWYSRRQRQHLVVNTRDDVLYASMSLVKCLQYCEENQAKRIIIASDDLGTQIEIHTRPVVQNDGTETGTKQESDDSSTMTRGDWQL